MTCIKNKLQERSSQMAWPKVVGRTEERRWTKDDG